MLNVILFAVGLAILLAVLLYVASIVLYVEEDPRLQDIIDLLPNQNCGLCGNPGCKGMAEAILREDAKLSQCKPGDQAMREEIKEFLETYDHEGNGVDPVKVKM